MIRINCNLFLLIMMIMIMCKFVLTWSLVSSSSSSYHSQKKRFFLLEQQQQKQHLTSFNSTTSVSTTMNRRRSKLKKNHDEYNSDTNKLDLELESNSLEIIRKNNFRVTSLIGKTVTLTCSIELDEVEFTKAANYRVI